MRFLDIATPLAARGVPVTPVMPNSKKAFLSDWPTSATIDMQTLALWDKQYPDYNGAAVATGAADGVSFFEVDDQAVLERIFQETGHDLMKEVETYMVRSRAGRGHFYFRNTPAVLALGNVSQSYVKNGDWSFRAQNQYVVAAGSIHPHSNEPYTALNPAAPIAPAPDWLIEWCSNQRVEKKPAPQGDIPRNENNRIPHGFIHGWLVRQAGRLREMGLGGSTLEAALLEIAHQQCEPPLDDDKIKQVARSFEAYPPGTNSELIFNQKPDPVAPPAVEIVEEIPTFDQGKYPEFPVWVMTGTSIYKNFVEPVCVHNSRVPYFMWLPAAAMVLNYLGTKVFFKGQFDSRPFNGSQYLVISGRRGETNKSSSVDDAMSYMHYAGMLAHAGRDLTSADGRTLVWTAGSPEGLGIDMQKSSCHNAILYYDELSQLVKKAGIESSTMISNLLTLYESKHFGNTVKGVKEKYALPPNSYCASMIALCTDESFAELWSKMNGSDTGLNDRTMFVMQPEKLPEKRHFIAIDFAPGAVETRRLVDKAINQKFFEFEDMSLPEFQSLVTKGARYAERAKKWALLFAVDLGLEVIDDECLLRGCAIVDYEIAVKRYQPSYEASNREAELQLRMRTKLEVNGGVLSLRELKRLCHADRVGTTLWYQSYMGLIRNNIIREEGTGKPGEPKQVRVLIKRDVEDE